MFSHTSIVEYLNIHYRQEKLVKENAVAGNRIKISGDSVNFLATIVLSPATASNLPDTNGFN
jgi:hypothetical protein